MEIREYVADDEAAVLALVLRAWEPVYSSVNGVLGTELALLLHGADWRDHQTAEVREALGSDGMSSWVAVDDGAVVGIASARVVDPSRRIGEVYLVGVDPEARRRGVGAALTRRAEEHLRDAGMLVSFISTGGDPGHADARRLYDGLGYTAFPSTQYFKAL